MAATGRKTFTGVPGMYQIFEPGLAYSSILMVSRSGAVHKEVASSPGSQEFSYDLATGTITFDSTNPFYSDPAVDDVVLSQFEKVHVIYKQ